MARRRKNPRTFSYFRVSSSSQSISVQREAVEEFARREGLKIDDSLSIECSTRKSKKARKIPELFENLQKGDTLIVSELSRLARSLSELVRLIDDLREKGVNLIAVKENIHLHEGQRDIQTKITFWMFSMLAEIERDLISERTKEGLNAARSKGRIGGRRKGQLQRSILDPEREKIEEFLKHKVSMRSLASMFNTTYPVMYHFCTTRGLVKRRTRRAAA